MPDRDRVERSLRPPWRAPYRLLKGGQPLEAVADALSRSIAKELRDQGAGSGFEPFLRLAVASESQPVSGKTLADVSRSLEQGFGQDRNAKLLARTMQKTRAKINAGQALPGARPFAEEFIRASIKHHFFAKVIFPSIGRKKRFGDVMEARDFERSVWKLLDPQLSKLANRLADNPNASGLRAPNSLRKRLSTSDLLDTPI
jgi:hypothetical protein